jgi:hypothetical protein
MTCDDGVNCSAMCWNEFQIRSKRSNQVIDNRSNHLSDRSHKTLVTGGWRSPRTLGSALRRTLLNGFRSRPMDDDGRCIMPSSDPSGDDSHRIVAGMGVRCKPGTAHKAWSGDKSGRLTGKGESTTAYPLMRRRRREQSRRRATFLPSITRRVNDRDGPRADRPVCWSAIVCSAHQV